LFISSKSQRFRALCAVWHNECFVMVWMATDQKWAASGNQTGILTSLMIIGVLVYASMYRYILSHKLVFPKIPILIQENSGMYLSFLYVEVDL
jgi:hypothetical protein